MYICQIKIHNVILPASLYAPMTSFSSSAIMPDRMTARLVPSLGCKYQKFIQKESQIRPPDNGSFLGMHKTPYFGRSYGQ